MRVTIEGKEDGKPITYVYSLSDKFDKRSNTTSMARTTGYTCTAVANLVAENKFHRKGICPPEYVGENEDCFYHIKNYLEERGVIYKLEVIREKEAIVL